MAGPIQRPSAHPATPGARLLATLALPALFTAAAVAIAVAMSSCGPDIDPALLNQGSKDRSDTSPDNFRLWKTEWKRGSWVVALRDQDWRNGRDSRLSHFQSLTHRAFISGAESVAARAGTSLTNRQAFALKIESLTHLDLIAHSPVLPDLLTITEQDRQMSFLAVSLSGVDDFKHHFATASGLPILDLAVRAGLAQDRDPERFLMDWQHLSLSQIDGAMWVEPNLYSKWSNTTATPYVPPEFEFRSGGAVEKLRLIKADLAYSHTGQGISERRPINVAVLDTGVDSKHPDLENQMWRNEGETPSNNQDDDGNGFKDDIHGIDATFAPGEDAGIAPRPGSDDIGGPGAACPSVFGNSDIEDDKLINNCGHGTHVAGIIAAQHGADTQTLGVCPNCRIMSVRVAERCVQPDTTKNRGDCVPPKTALREDQYEVDGNIADVAQIRALQYLFNTRSPSNRGTLAVNIVNMSLGKYFRSRSMGYLLQKLQESNVAIVAAAGNDDTDTPSFPAAYESVVAVCATSSSGRRGDYGKADFSNFGEWVDICAPGEDINSTVPGRSGSGSGNSDDKDGTSQATPFVSGALGYLMSVSPNQRDVRQFINILKKAASSDLLYRAEANRIPGSDTDSAFIACYKDRSSCDYLLGTGFLNLHKAVNPTAPGEPFSEVDLNKKLPVSGGCVVSAAGSSQQAHINLLTSMPFLLAKFPALLIFLRYLRRRQRRMAL